MRKPWTAVWPLRPRPGRGALAATGTFLLPLVLLQAGPLCAGELVSAHGCSLVPLLLACGQPVVAPDVEEAEPRTRQSLNQFLYRDRRQQITLARAKEELAAGNYVAGVTALQEVLNEPEDAFLWNESASVGARLEAARILATIDREGAATYERLYGAEAKALLASARQTSDSRLYGEIGRRFYHTDAGFKAVNFQASRWFDHGEFRLAAQTWERLIADPVHAVRVTPSVRLKASLARQMADSLRQGDDPRTRIGWKTAELTGGTVIPAEFAAPANRTAVGANRTAVPAVVFKVAGDANREPSPATSRPSAPFLRPLWSAPLSRRPNELLEQSLRSWEMQREEQSLSAATANAAVVADGKVLLRDFETIRAYDIDSGRSLWSYHCATSLTSAVDDLLRQYSRSPNTITRTGSLVEFHAGNSALGTLTTDGRRVYVIDFVEMSPAPLGIAALATVNTAETPPNRSSKLVSRETNRLVALSLDAPESAAETERLPLWSIGGSLGAPNWFYRMDADDDGRITPGEFIGPPDQFAAIDADQDAVIVKSEARTVESADESEADLAGHFFLGPPLPAAGRLYAVTEADRQLNLIALDPQTGALVWKQGIGFVDRPIDVDTSRYSLDCTPHYSDGVVICPTQLGVLVGVDGETGTLLWAYDCSDQSDDSDGWSNLRASYGAPGFRSIPLVVGDRVVVMPRQSLKVHCIDLWTGKPLWQAPRNDTEFVAASDGRRVLLVGRQSCRGISLETGELVWSSRIGTASGRGLHSGANYLLPLQEGRVATIELATGRQIGHSSITDALQESGDLCSPGRSWRPGNLVADDQFIVSVESQQIVAFPQTAPLLEQAYDELAENPDSPAHRLLAGELELVLGNLGAANSHLSAAMRGTLAEDDRRRAEDLLREQLYLELHSGLGDSRMLLEQLEHLARSPRERGRYLIQLAEWQLSSGQFDGVLEATSEFAKLELDELLPMAANDQHLVSAASWIPSIIERLKAKSGPVELSALHDHVDAIQQQALDAGNVEPLKNFLAVYSDWPQAAEARTRLSTLLMGRGRLQEAELLLLQNRMSENPVVAATTTRLLAELWDHAGLAEESASLLGELLERFGDTEVADGVTGRQYVANFPKGGLTGMAYRRLMSSELPTDRVRISSVRWFRNDPELTSVYERYRRRLVTPNGSTFQLLDKNLSQAGNVGDGGAQQAPVDPKLDGFKKLMLEAHANRFRTQSEDANADGRLTIIDTQGGIVRGDIAVPSNNSFRQFVSLSSQHGHLFPFGSPAQMHGVSLLEYQDGKPLWSIAGKGIGSQQQAIRVGPYGASFCSFQSGRHLVVVDPADGRVRWQRSDLDPNSGLYDNSYTGLFGDEHVLVLFMPVRQTYTVYSTATGEELRTGRLDADTRQPQRAFGRKLQYFTRSAAGNRLMIWDPLEDRHVLDMLIEGRPYSQVTDENELVVVLPPERLYIFDVITGQVRLDVQFKPEAFDNFFTPQVFSDHERYYINLQCPGAVPASLGHIRYARDRFVPAVNVKGDLYAVDRKSGTILWKRTEPERSFVQTPHVRLPFLIALSHLGGIANQDAMLLEVIDAATGRTIATQENLSRDCILQFCYDAAERRVELRGKQTVIDIEFGLAPLPVPSDDRPL